MQLKATFAGGKAPYAAQPCVLAEEDVRPAAKVGCLASHMLRSAKYSTTAVDLRGAVD